jgi:hypothetical protein
LVLSFAIRTLFQPKLGVLVLSLANFVNKLYYWHSIRQVLWFLPPKQYWENFAPKKIFCYFLKEYFAKFLIMLKFYLNNNNSKPGTYKKNIEKILPQKKILLFFMGIYRQFFFILLKFYLNNKCVSNNKSYRKTAKLLHTCPPANVFFLQ